MTGVGILGQGFMGEAHARALVTLAHTTPYDVQLVALAGRDEERLRRMAREFQGQFNEAIREAELEDVKKSIQDIAKVDPVADIKAETAKIDQSIRSELNKAVPTEAELMKPISPPEPAPPVVTAEPEPVAGEAKS